MSVTIHRCFHPVGQGAFYSERFQLPKRKSFNVVYDCGSDLAFAKWKNVINEQYRKDEEIEFLFLSHFHRDHVSGVQYLLERCRVKNVFLPLLTKEAILLSLAKNAIESERNLFVERLLVHPVETIQSHGRKQDGYPGPRVFFVPPGRNEQNWEMPLPLNPNTFRSDQQGRDIWESGKPLGLEIPRDMNNGGIDRWCFVPFNLESQTRSSEFQNNLEAHGITPESLTDFASAWKEKKKEITGSFQTITSGKKGDQNENSLVLYSGPFRDGDPQGQSLFTSKHVSGYQRFHPANPKWRLEYLHEWRHLVREMRFVCNSLQCERVLELLEQLPDVYLSHDTVVPFRQLGALYMGDYRAKEPHHWTELEGDYQPWLQCIGIIQVPHHGSAQNYNKEIGRAANFHVISCGKKNWHGHPSPQVVTEIVRTSVAPFLVTESPDSEVVQLIRLE